MAKPIIVGVDGSEPSLTALDWAVHQAHRRKAPVRIVHGRPGLLTEREEQIFAATGEVVLRKAADRARGSVPDLDVTTEMAEESAAPSLVVRSGDATMVVVGSRGLGGFKGLLLGSVSLQVATHAVSPVVVVRPEPEPVTTKPEILVGVDVPRTPSGAVDAALAFAFEEAALRDGRLRALHTWRHPVAAAPGDMLPVIYDLDAVQEDEELLLAEALAGWREKYPDIEVLPQVEQGPAAHALVRASAGAQLVVLGSRGGGGFRDLLLGSVTHTVLHHAHCPVAVVH